MNKYAFEFSEYWGRAMPGVFFKGWESISDNFIRSVKAATNYPPYNIAKYGGQYVIELGVAGFTKDQLNVEFRDNVLSVTGKKKSLEPNAELYLFHGLASRDFMRQFVLSPSMEITNTELANGLLTIYLSKKNIEKTASSIPINEPVSTAELLNEGDQPIHRGGLPPNEEPTKETYVNGYR